MISYKYQNLENISALIRVFRVPNSLHSIQNLKFIIHNQIKSVLIRLIRVFRVPDMSCYILDTLYRVSIKLSSI